MPGVALVLVSSTIFATATIGAKLATEEGGLTVGGLVAARLMLSGAVLWAAVRATNVWPPPLPSRTLALQALVGLCYGGQMFLFYWAITRMPVSTASVLVFTYPIIVMGVAVTARLEGFEWRLGAASVVAVAGAALVIGWSHAELDPVALLAVAASTLLYALYVVWASALDDAVHSLLTSAVVVTSGGVAFVATLVASGAAWGEPTGLGWALILYLGIFATPGGVLALMSALHFVSASIAAIVTTWELVIVLALATVLFDEDVTAVQGAGIFLIAFAVGIVLLRRRPAGLT